MTALSSSRPVVREVLGNGLRLITESMPHVRSVTIGVWLMRGSRHESEDRGGIAHFVEHMLFKGTDTRTAEDIAQAIDSIGGQLDAFTAKEYASYYIKVLDEHLPLAVDLLSDIVLRPAFSADEVEREKKVILEEIKMVEDTPDDLVHELFTQHFWEGHALGRPILGSKETVESFTAASLLDYFRGAYVGRNMIISAAGNLEHARVRELVEAAFGAVAAEGEPLGGAAGVHRKHSGVAVGRDAAEHGIGQTALLANRLEEPRTHRTAEDHVQQVGRVSVDVRLRKGRRADDDVALFELLDAFDLRRTRRRRLLLPIRAGVGNRAERFLDHGA